uniref:Synaptonemal complex central element protein 2 n=1 Tax=Kryptolebias marmoratus TaxID=37003 RepID=A0A3Q3BGW2_KRYMA
ATRTAIRHEKSPRVRARPRSRRSPAGTGRVIVALNVSEGLIQRPFSFSSSVDDISRRAQEMVEKINRSRTSDQDVMDGFQEKLTEKVTEMCRQMKEHMYALYERNSDEMQVKLQELSEVLDSCTKLNQELLEASQALTLLREGLGLTQPSNQ